MTVPRSPTDHDICGARSRSGGACRRPAGWGTDHVGVGRCKLHGGCTPNHRASAAAEIVEREATDVLVRLGRPEPMGHPVEELLALAAEVRAWQRILRERVAELRSVVHVDAHGAERERAAVVLYERSLDRSARLLVDLARLDLDARLARVQEAQAELLGQVIASVMSDVGVPAATWQPAAARHLRALEPAS